MEQIVGMYYALSGFEPPPTLLIAESPSHFAQVLLTESEIQASPSIHPLLLEGFRKNLLKPLNDWLIDKNLVNRYQSIFNTSYRTKFLNLKNQRDLIASSIFDQSACALKIKKIPSRDFFTATYIEQIFIDFLKCISKEHEIAGLAGLYLDMYQDTSGFMSYFTREAAIILRWPDKFEYTNDGILHAPHEPALQWGAETHYFYNGWNIHRDFFENPSALSPSIVLGEKNVEKRRAYMEILGSSRFAELLDLEIKDQAADQFGNLLELYRTRSMDELAREHLQFVRVICPSTGRNYMLCVPPDIATAREAVAWTFGKSADEYRPLEET